MSDRMTTITLPGAVAVGYQDWGVKTPAEMIKTIREHAAEQLRQANAVIEAADEDFRVETHTGMHVKRNRKVLQRGRAVGSNA